MALTKRKLIRWLVENDFEELPGKASSHKLFRHRKTAKVISVPMHGRPELSKKHLGMVLRQLESAGFDKQQARAELS